MAPTRGIAVPPRTSCLSRLDMRRLLRPIVRSSQREGSARGQSSLMEFGAREREFTLRENDVEDCYGSARVAFFVSPRSLHSISIVAAHASFFMRGAEPGTRAPVSQTHGLQLEIS